jgi:hypothetical protein
MRALRKPAAMYGITRAASGKGWKVGLKRDGVALDTQFSFGLHGGEEAALLRAQAWRDEMVKKHPPPPRRKLAERLISSNKTGIAGVSCKLDPNGEPMAWIAQTRIAHGQSARKFFSVKRYGAAEAKLLAIAERQKQLEQMTGLQRVHPSEAAIRKAPLRETGPLPERLDPAVMVRTTNSSGVVGVTLHKNANGQPVRWKVQTYIGDTRRVETFSIKVFGFEQAKALAIAVRQEHLEMRAQLQRVRKPSAR